MLRDLDCSVREHERVERLAFPCFGSSKNETSGNSCREVNLLRSEIRRWNLSWIGQRGFEKPFRAFVFRGDSRHKAAHGLSTCGIAVGEFPYVRVHQICVNGTDRHDVRVTFRAFIQMGLDLAPMSGSVAIEGIPRQFVVGEVFHERRDMTIERALFRHRCRRKWTYAVEVSRLSAIAAVVSPSM